MQLMDDVKIVNALSVNDIKQSVQSRKKVLFLSEQYNPGEETDQQGEGNGKSLLQESCLVHPKASPGMLDSTDFIIIIITFNLQFYVHKYWHVINEYLPATVAI